MNTLPEIESWARAGIRSQPFFEAATLENARALRLENEIGSIRPGMQAVLLLLGSNPLQSVTAYDDIHIVFADGVLIARSELLAR